MRLVFALATLVALLPTVGFGAQSEAGPKGVTCREFAAAFRAGTFDLGVGRTRLKDGTSCIVARPGGPCEWAVELMSLERWGKGGRFLMASLYANHLTGTGAWHSVFVYECRGGTYRQVFDASILYGAKIELGQDAEFVLTSNQWSPDDPLCCPSSERRNRYVWDASRGRFVQMDSQVVPKKP